MGILLFMAKVCVRQERFRIETDLVVAIDVVGFILGQKMNLQNATASAK